MLRVFRQPLHMFDLVCYRDRGMRLLRNRYTIQVFLGVALCRIPRLFSIRIPGVAWFSFDLYELYISVVFSFVVFARCWCMVTGVGFFDVKATPFAAVSISYATKISDFSFVDVFFAYVDSYFTRTHWIPLSALPIGATQGWRSRQLLAECRNPQPTHPLNALAIYVCLVPFVTRLGWSFTNKRCGDPVVLFVFLFTD